MSLIENLRTLLTLKGKNQSDLPSTASMVDWMLQLNKEVPDLDTLVQRLEMIERIKSDTAELGRKIQEWSALYERVCVDYATLLDPTGSKETANAENCRADKSSQAETVNVEVVDVLPTEVEEQIQSYRNRLESSARNGQAKVGTVRPRHTAYGNPVKIRYHIRTNS